MQVQFSHSGTPPDPTTRVCEADIARNGHTTATNHPRHRIGNSALIPQITAVFSRPEFGLPPINTFPRPREDHHARPASFRAYRYVTQNVSVAHRGCIKSAGPGMDALSSMADSERGGGHPYSGRGEGQRPGPGASRSTGAALAAIALSGLVFGNNEGAVG